MLFKCKWKKKHSSPEEYHIPQIHTIKKVSYNTHTLYACFTYNLSGVRFPASPLEFHRYILLPSRDMAEVPLKAGPLW